MASHHGGIDRRELLRNFGLGLLGTSCASWLPSLAAEIAQDPRRRRHCILLWMSGGPSQTDLFDMKPGHANGGEFKEVATSVPGLRFSEHLPKLGKFGDQLAVVRSLTTKEGDHARGTHLVRTGHPPAGEVAYPSIACALAKELEYESVLPNYVTVAPPRDINPAAFEPGFLGARYAPAIVAGSGGPPAPGAAPMALAKPVDLKMADLELPPDVNADEAARRLALWNTLERKFLDGRHANAFETHNALYRKAADLMTPDVRKAFDLTTESDKLRSQYGNGVFGQGCLLARRLVERGVPFVEVALGDGLGWDTHQDNFRRVKKLSEELDAGWATLMGELQERDLLKDTTILWISEFGRTPQINGNAGRDHFPAAWSCVFAGGGIKGGQAYGKTSADGTTVEEKQVGIGDVLATLSTALGVPPDHENVTASNRPIKIAEGTPIHDILA
ncbi:MAG TPA: DUF1501 domain-containing protein [Lacipirellulaceae bacterium]|nr:DUF1501 domain-containing protein [Lacipirellulaceae bacterium]